MHLLDQIYSILCLQIEVAAIQKAINSTEGPIKHKHVRSAIISTFQGECGQTFWAAIGKLPVMENKIVAWKLCYVVHKILREGHPMCLVHSQRHAKELDDMGKFWENIRDDYGKMIKCYTQLLLTKLEFHKRNSVFSGSIDVTADELELLGTNDVNVYFQLVIEMLDYIDRILELQSAIFSSLDMSRANSVTKAGQCKLTPLMPCIQDASRLYNYCVKLLFKLHGKLPLEVLSGHRDRFFSQYSSLRNFYENANNLQYFKGLISVPVLPEEPPNFVSSLSFSECSLTTMECDEGTKENLIADISKDDNSSQASSSSDLSQFSLYLEREHLIKHLQKHSESLRTEIIDMVSQHNIEINQLQNKICLLEFELATKEKQLGRQQPKENLVSQSCTESQISEKIGQNVEFDKMKNLYFKLQEEHIELLRQKSDLEEKIACKQNKAEPLSEADNYSICVPDHWMPFEKNKELLLQIFERGLNETFKNNKTINLATPNEDCNKIMQYFIEASKIIIQDTISEIDTTALTSMSNNSDYLSKLEKSCSDSLKFMKNVEHSNLYDYVLAVIKFTYSHIMYIIFAKTLINSSEDLMSNKKIELACDKIKNCTINVLENIHNKESLELEMDNLESQVKSTTSLGETMTLQYLSAVTLQSEITSMDLTIKEATKRLQEILNKPRLDDAGINVEVDEKVKSCYTDLMETISSLILKSKFLQAEVVSQGKDTNYTKDFYKRNHQWTNGFISAAKAIAASATFFVNVAEKVLAQQGKVEELIVAAQEIAATTIQLIVASKVKADSGSKNLVELIGVSKNVISATSKVIATVKENSKNEKTASTEEIGATNITLHEAKMLEIESQVRILELEKQLQDERQKLSVIRKQHYQMDGEIDPEI